MWNRAPGAVVYIGAHAPDNVLVRANGAIPRGIARCRRPMAMTLRLTEAEQEVLRVTAEREQRSKQAVAATAINQHASGRTRRVSEAIDRVLVEDADLLADLA